MMKIISLERKSRTAISRRWSCSLDDLKMGAPDTPQQNPTGFKISNTLNEFMEGLQNLWLKMYKAQRTLTGPATYEAHAGHPTRAGTTQSAVAAVKSRLNTRVDKLGASLFAAQSSTASAPKLAAWIDTVAGNGT
jgi:hypothetical protein